MGNEPGPELQASYAVTRNGKEVPVPRAQLTPVERASIVARLRELGDACHHHADDLEKESLAGRNDFKKMQ